VKIETAAVALVLAAGSEHAVGRGVERTPDNFSMEAKLHGSNVLDTWNGIEHAAHLLVRNVLFLHINDGDVENLLDALVKEYFETA
jgi:hypothetical protein